MPLYFLLDYAWRGLSSEPDCFDSTNSNLKARGTPRIVRLDAKENHMNNGRPSLEAWLAEIKRDSKDPAIGIFFIHDGVVRGTTADGSPVCSLDLSYDPERLAEVITQVEAMPGVAAARVWINEGNLPVGEDMICALVAGDVRKNVLIAWQTLVRRIKLEVITQQEILASPGLLRTSQTISPIKPAGRLGDKGLRVLARRRSLRQSHFRPTGPR